ncbi:hypothetical protein ACFO9E_00145 [Streptomyces maoxianensis]|uniref:Uncharacterized protein n=1 Tax=Streptomyces maoxianensis TaxID=1459942 RepID=A0ABV9FZQ2_9ACTN
MRATAAGVFADHGGPVRALHTDGQEPALLDYLFRDGLPLPHWGLCLSGRPEKLVAAEAEVGIYTHFGDGEVRGITVAAGVVGLRLSLAAPAVGPSNLMRRPRRIELASDHTPVMKVHALAWSEGDRQGGSHAAPGRLRPVASVTHRRFGSHDDEAEQQVHHGLHGRLPA